MKLAVLTSSRADFGIYLPLLRLIRKRADEFDLSIIAFGTHLSKFHGYTKAHIIEQGFEVAHEVPGLLLTDDSASVASSYALTALKFADFWQQQAHVFDGVICLGDRFEMAAAVAAGIPLGVRFAHIHGGETTLGAIDNIYRHSISLAADLHFVSTESFRQRIYEICGAQAKCWVTGALSLDNLEEISLLSKEEFTHKWGISFDEPFILVTIHPETVAFQQNARFAQVVHAALRQLLQQHKIVLTMPNADTAGTIFREAFLQLHAQFPERVYLIENFGTQSYFTCMKYADFLLGNTSSGIVEAASFQKFVLNIGDRQKGRLAGENVLHLPFDEQQIVVAAKQITGKQFTGINLYQQGKAAPIILDAIQQQWQ